MVQKPFPINILYIDLYERGRCASYINYTIKVQWNINNISFQMCTGATLQFQAEHENVLGFSELWANM